MKTTLLIAEDDAELRDIYRHFLTKCGFEVEAASDGLDCVEKLSQGSPAVLVLDRGLLWGGADGVLAWLREERFPPEIAVVLTATGSASPGTPEGIRSPVVRFLAKPFALTALLESVRAAIAEKRQEEPLIDWNREEAYPEFFPGLMR